MIFRLLVFVLIAYVAWKFLRADLRRRFARYQPAPRVAAVETVKCPGCGTYVAQGVAHECVPSND